MSRPSWEFWNLQRSRNNFREVTLGWRPLSDIILHPFLVVTSNINTVIINKLINIIIIIVICHCHYTIRVRRNLIFPLFLIFAVPSTLNVPVKDASAPASSFSLENGFFQNFIWGLSTPVMSKAFFFQCKCAFKSIICVANNTKNANRIFIAKRQCLFFTKNLSKVGDLQLFTARCEKSILISGFD